jgi:cyclophilin family peptidyl-prolyl cis-trans isomerase
MLKRETVAAGVVACALLLAPVAASADPKPVDVAIVTTLGRIVVEVDTVHAPETSANFLRHVDAGVYDRGATFYRTASQPGLSIVQGGIEPRDDAMPPIPVEKTTTTGLHNVAGTIAMARTSDPNSATSEFFINTGDDRRLDADRMPDGYGYAVFGTIVKGDDVIAKIQHAAASGETLTPPVKIVRIRRVERYVSGGTGAP